MHDIEHILVATDLSEKSRPALEMAMLIAKKSGAAIRLIYVYHVPSPGSNVMIRIADVVQDRAKKRMDRLVEELKGAYPEVVIDSLISTGQAAIMVRKELRSSSYDLLVMGGDSSDINGRETHGTSSLMVDVDLPILIVPHSFRKGPDSIHRPILAVHPEDPDLEGHVERLWTWSKFFGWDDIHVVNLDAKGHGPNGSTDAMETLSHAYHGRLHQSTFEGEDVDEALMAIGRKEEADLFLLLREPKSYLTAIASKMIGRRMAEYSQIPVFIIP